MATEFYSRVSYIADGSTKIFNFNFPYFVESHVKVSIDKVETNNYSFLSENTLELDSIPTQGSIVTIYRKTPKDRIIDFQDGSILNADTLDNDSNQMMFLVQEATDELNNLITLDIDDAYNVRSKRLKNVKDAEKPTDGMNMRSAMEYLDLTKQARDIALEAKEGAETARSLSEIAQSKAEIAELGAKDAEEETLNLKNKADSFANENEDIEVETGKYSAKHWSLKAQKNANIVPTGIIVMWSGTTLNIPTGWSLCDGTNETPDLRDRFVVGAGNSYAVGDTGGAESVALTESHLPVHSHSGSDLIIDSNGSHTHTGSTNSTGNHYHSVSGTAERHGSSMDDGYGYKLRSRNTSTNGAHSHSVSINSNGAHTHSISGTTSSTGGGEAHENRPPYYALAYIMKL